MLTADIDKKNNLESKVIEQKKMVICNHKSNLQFFLYVSTYVIFLSLQFLAEVELLGLQLHHPLPELTGLLSERTNQKLRQWPLPHHQLTWLWWLTSVYLQTDDRRWVASFCLPGSSSSSLSPSVSSPPLRPSPCKKKIDSVWFIFTWYCCSSSFIKKIYFLMHDIMIIYIEIS